MPVNKWNIKGGREKKAIKLAGQTPAKAHGNAPADLPGPPPDPGLLEIPDFSSGENEVMMFLYTNINSVSQAAM